MEAIFITSDSSLIFEYPVSGSPPSWKTISQEISSSRDSQILQSTTSSNYVIYQFQHGSFCFVIIADPTVSPALPAQFVQLLTDSMTQYFVLSKLDSNYDTVTLILSEILDNGAPYLSEPDQVREFVSKGGVLSKLLSQNVVSKPVRSDAPYWRRQNVRHTQNELFVDIEESITCIVRRQGSQKTIPVVSYIDGAVFLTSHLSGIPEIELSLSRNISGGKHVCITKTGAASRFRFTPPDGRTRILTYSEEVNIGSHLVNCTFHTGLGLQKDEFEVRVGVTMNRNVKGVDNLSVDVFGGKIKTLRVTQGDFITHQKGGTWSLGQITPMGFNATFRGITDGGVSHVTLKYSLQGAVPSGLKVDSVNIVAARGLGEGVKPYKGVKYVTEVAEYVVR